VASLDDFKDKGLGGVTGNRFHNGKFRTPTLRNIAFSAPYMHDGRFQTLEECVAQYADNGFGVENEDIFIGQMGFPLGNGKYSGLNAYQQRALVKFLHALTDTVAIHNPDFQNPFK
jgi:cytochrome c peroxidase